MRVEQFRWTAGAGWEPRPPGGLRAALVLAFGGGDFAEQADRLEQARRAYPEAHLLGCSTAGQILETHVTDDALTITAVAFDTTRVAGAKITIASAEESNRAGRSLAQRLEPEGLVHVLVLSEGLAVNGSDLVRGLMSGLPPGVTVTGGLSGDGTRFAETSVAWDGPPERGTVAVAGLYGSRLRVGYGSLGGWDPFGPDRVITRSRRNVLFELDGRNALALYKEYLGEHATGLPATGLLFPLSVRAHAGDPGVVRTILGVNEDQQSLVFAGDVPEGALARLMKANFDRLIDGAVGAAQRSIVPLAGLGAELALLISCVGRKLVLKQRVEEEIEGVRDVVGPGAALAGFYSYGEISPFTPSARCELHNQTMTVTAFAER